MGRKHEPERLSSADHAQAQRERDAQDKLLDKGADQLQPRPWRPAPPPYAHGRGSHPAWPPEILIQNPLKMQIQGAIRSKSAQNQNRCGGQLRVGWGPGGAGGAPLIKNITIELQVICPPPLRICRKLCRKSTMYQKSASGENFGRL